MNVNTVLDVVIGLSLVYLSASLFVTVINEYLSRLLKLRSRQLVTNLGELMADSGLVDNLKANPALAKFFGNAVPGKIAKWLGGTSTGASSYVDTKVLAQQLIGALTPAAAGASNLTKIIGALETRIAAAEAAAKPGAAPATKLETQLLALAKSTDEKIEKLVDNVASWADQSLTMMGEAYKKRVQTICFLVGLAIAAAFNIDTLSIVARLWNDEETRVAMAAYATEFVGKLSDEEFTECLAKPSDSAEAKAEPCATVWALATSLRGNRERTAATEGAAAGASAATEETTDSPFAGLPIGYPVQPVWDDDPYLAILTVAIGWLLTALATALGAPFWFDLLNRVTNVRQSMRKPEEQT